MAKRKRVPSPDGLIYERYSGSRNRKGGKVGASKIRARDPATGRFVASEVARVATIQAMRREGPRVALRVRVQGGSWRNWRDGDSRRRLQVAKFVGNKLDSILSHDWQQHKKSELAMLDAGLTRIREGKNRELLEFSGRGESISDCLEPLDFGPIGYGGIYAWEIQTRVVDGGSEIKLYADGVEDFRPHITKSELAKRWQRSEHISHGLPDGETYQSVLKHNIAAKLRKAFSARQIRFSSLQVLERIKDPKRWNHFPGKIVADALYTIWADKEQVFELKFSLRFRVLKEAKTTNIANLAKRTRNKKQKIG